MGRLPDRRNPAVSVIRQVSGYTSFGDQMGVYKCQMGCVWALLLAVIFAVVPRSWESELQAETAFVREELPPPPVVVEGTFELRETLSTTLVGHDVSHAAAYAVGEAVRSVFNVRSFRPGHAYRLLMGPEGDLLTFEYSIDEESILKVVGNDDGFAARVEALPLETRTDVISATVASSLWGALEGSPKGDWLVMELASIFEAQVDFYKDLRSGDAIHLIVDAKYHDGEFVKYDSVLAAEFVNRGKPMQAYRFREDYYDERGMSARRSLLPSPLQFTRISSGFSYSRLHPIYNHGPSPSRGRLRGADGNSCLGGFKRHRHLCGNEWWFRTHGNAPSPEWDDNFLRSFVFDCGQCRRPRGAEGNDWTRRNDRYRDRSASGLPDDGERQGHRSADSACGSAETHRR